MEKDKRIRINKRMMAWSNGERTNIIPSIYCQVNDYGQMEINYESNLKEGYEVYWGDCYVVLKRCQCNEYEADRLWKQGNHLQALKEMMYAATFTLPDDEPMFEDVQWLDPEETSYWHPNVREYLRLNRRCIEYCERDPRLWPIYNGSSLERSYHKYLKDLNEWLHSC